MVPGGERFLKAKTLNEVHAEGMDALLKVLGPVDTIRFLRMFDEGEGDYTKERKAWLKEDVHEISREIREMKKKQVI
jgi:pyruvate-formate lyase-activating enzyme